MKKSDKKVKRTRPRLVSSPLKTDPFFLPVKNISKKSGTTVVDLRFLRDWLGTDADKFLEAIRRNGRGHIAVQPTYLSRRVLQAWAEISVSRNWPLPSLEMAQDELIRQLSRLRETFFSNEVKAGNALSTAGAYWDQFTRLLDDLAATKALPPIARNDSRIASPDPRLLLANRTYAASSPVSVSTAPRNLNVARDSFNDDLFEPISILAADDEYLEEYQKRLEHSIDTIRACAVRDFEELEKKRQEGKELISQFDPSLLEKFKGSSSRRFVDQATGKSLVKAADGHPDFLKTLLGIVVHDMGGLPQPHFYYSTKKEKHYVEGGWPYWYAIQRYNKNKLLPYLGIMSSEAAGICMLLIMLEHPKFNASSMYRARITRDKSGQSCITTSGLTREGSLRFEVAKPRAAEDKSGELSELAKRVLTRVVEWTKPVRDVLRKAGSDDEAAMLWVGMSAQNYRMMRFSERAIFISLVGKSQRQEYGEKANANRATAFLDRHAELAPWADKITFKSIRVNLGVLVYLQSGGDLVATARAFGHKNVATTIGNYIPNALRFAIYERQVRRHQNRLLAGAVEPEQDRLKVMDFRTIEELHRFLASLRQEAPGSDAPPLTRERRPGPAGSRLVICDDPEAFAIAMIYRDKLKAATTKFLDRPDRATGLKPRFWCEFVDAVVKPLPLAMSPIATLVRKARERKATLEATVTLPEIG